VSNRPKFATANSVIPPLLEMSADLDKSVERLVAAEGRTAYSVGHSLTRQGQALTAKYLPALIRLIEAEKAGRRSDWAILQSLKPIKNDDLARRLLVAGINVAAAKDLGADRETGQKTYRDIALWMGRQFGERGEVGFKLGAWATDLLSQLEGCFSLDGDILILAAPVADFFDAVMAEEVKNHPLLTPRLEPPQPWTQFHRGALPPDHWAKCRLFSITIVPPKLRSRMQSLPARWTSASLPSMHCRRCRWRSMCRCWNL
jgi:hypothetical protein